MTILTVLYFILSVVICGVSILAVQKIAHKFKLYDVPNDRKLHAKPIPSLGGVGIFLSFWILVFLLCNPIDEVNIIPILFGSLLLFFVSLWDDLQPINPIIRLVVQWCSASIAFYELGNFTVYSVLLNPDLFPLIGQYLFTVFLFLLLINAYNLIDGINGLSGSLGLVSTLSFTLLFALQGQLIWSMISFIMAGGLLAFLKFNFNKASIFMGDNGSTFLGFMLAVFVIKYSNYGIVSVSTYHLWVTAGTLVAIPVLDLIRVTVLRMAGGKSPFSADQTHIHHLLIKGGCSHQFSSVLIVLIQLAVVFISQYYLNSWSALKLLFSIIGIYSLAIFVSEISLIFTAIKASEKRRQRISLF